MNNNWEELLQRKTEYLMKAPWIIDEADLRSLANSFSELKDQEHKAELEMIKGEVQKLLEKLPELESDEYDAGLFDMKHLVLSIIDSHINKLSTE